MGENGRFRPLKDVLLGTALGFPPVRVPLAGGGVKGRRDDVGEGTRIILASLAETEGPVAADTGGCVADVGVGSGGATCTVGRITLEAVARRFFVGGPPFPYELLDGSVGGWGG